MANPSGHKSHHGAQGTGGRWLLPTSWPAWPAYSSSRPDTSGGYRVDAIVDVPHSATALAVLNLTGEKMKPLLLSGPAASEITGPLCTRTSVHWTYDSYANGKAVVSALAKQGLKSWFFLTGDNAGTQALERDAVKFIRETG